MSNTKTLAFAATGAAIGTVLAGPIGAFLGAAGGERLAKSTRANQALDDVAAFLGNQVDTARAALQRRRGEIEPMPETENKTLAA